MQETGYIPPHSIEAEQAVLGALFVDPSCFDAVAALLPKPAAFWRHSHQLIYAAMLKVRESDAGNVDWLNVSDQVVEDGNAADCGGREALHAYLSEVSQGVPSAYGAERYATIVRDRWLKRELIQRAGDLRAAALDETKGTGDVIERLLRDATELAALKPGESRAGSPVVLCLGDVEPEPIEWLWRSRVALGKLTIIAGNPGLGKSTVTLDMAARVTTGAAWPDACGSAPLGDVLLISAEDDAADTIRPRLDVAGANVKRVHLLRGKTINDKGKKREVGITLQDVPMIEATLAKLPACKLLVVDPIAAFMGDSDSHNDAEVRALLAPFALLAAQRGIAVVIVAHLNKSSGQQALHRISGSIGFVGAARAAWVVTAHPDDEDQRLFASVKNNLAANPGALGFRLRTRNNSDHAAVEWIEGFQDVNIENLVGGVQENRSAMDNARTFLLSELNDGPLPTKEILRRAGAAGHSKRTLDAVKAVLKIESLKVTQDGVSYWTWCLPQHRNLAQFSTPLQPCNLDATPPVKPLDGGLFGKVARLQDAPLPSNLAARAADLTDQAWADLADENARKKKGKSQPVLTLVKVDAPPSGNGKH